MTGWEVMDNEPTQASSIESDKELPQEHEQDTVTQINTLEKVETKPKKIKKRKRHRKRKLLESEEGGEERWKHIKINIPDKPLRRYTVHKCLVLLRTSAAWPHSRYPRFSDTAAVVTLTAFRKRTKKYQVQGLLRTFKLPHPRSSRRSVLLISKPNNIEQQQQALETVCKAAGINGKVKVLPLSKTAEGIDELVAEVAAFDMILVSEEFTKEEKKFIEKKSGASEKHFFPVQLGYSPLNQIRSALAKFGFWFDMNNGTCIVQVGDSGMSLDQLIANVQKALQQIKMLFPKGFQDFQAILTIGESPPKQIDYKEYVKEKIQKKWAEKKKQQAENTVEDHEMSKIYNTLATSLVTSN